MLVWPVVNSVYMGVPSELTVYNDSKVFVLGDTLDWHIVYGVGGNVIIRHVRFRKKIEIRNQDFFKNQQNFVLNWSK